MSPFGRGKRPKRGGGGEEGWPQHLTKMGKKSSVCDSGKEENHGSGACA